MCLMWDGNGLTTVLGLIPGEKLTWNACSFHFRASAASVLIFKLNKYINRHVRSFILFNSSLRSVMYTTLYKRNVCLSHYFSFLIDSFIFCSLYIFRTFFPGTRFWLSPGLFNFFLSLLLSQTLSLLWLSSRTTDGGGALLIVPDPSHTIVFIFWNRNKNTLIVDNGKKASNYFRSKTNIFSIIILLATEYFNAYIIKVFALTLGKTERD